MPRLDLGEILAQEDQPPDWLVADMFCQGSMVVLAGEPGVGKSVVSYTLAVATAAGIPFLGRRTALGHVLYFDEENALPDVRQYLKWAWRGLGQPAIEPIAERLHLEHFSLAHADTKRWEHMESLATEFAPHLIVFDTVTPACRITDENDNSEASRAIARLRRVQRVAGPQCTLILLKHAKVTHEKDARRTIRGAKAWLGECDAVIYHSASAGRRRKDGLRMSRLEADKVRAFGLREPIAIDPSWTGDEHSRGLHLAARIFADENDD